MEVNKIIYGDCFEVMPKIPDNCIDMILCDLPYGTTKNKWDIIIPFKPLWRQYKRIIKNNGAIVLFCDGMFMAELMISNKAMWRYNLIWDKVLSSGFLNANKMPLRSHEEICVFYKSSSIYNPQKIKGRKNHSMGRLKERRDNDYGKYKFVDNSKLLGNMKHPKSIIIESKLHSSIAIHPTQKPVALFEYLIKTYTNKGDLVLDNCAGSGTTGVACKNLGRNYILIEKEKEYYEIAKEKINAIPELLF